MIPERFMVTAETITKGVHVGYITTSPDGSLLLEWREYGMHPDNPSVPQTVKAYVDTDSIEPVAVKIAPLPGHSNANCDFQHGRERGLCPNCGKGIGMWDYCPLCGQRLDWRRDNE